MRYMTLIYNDPAELAKMSEAEQGAFFQAYMAFNEEAQKRGALRDGVQLHPVTTATTVRVRDGKIATVDGPFAETKEYLGGIYVLECANLDEAIELAAMIPSAKHGSIEVRPILGFAQEA
ncbi:MAG: YciI family protein [Aggregatilineales bacterium]